MKIKNLVYTLLVLIIGGFIAYRVVSNSKKGGDSKDKGGKDKPMNVSGIVIKTQVFKNNLSLSGSIEANDLVIESSARVKGDVIYSNLTIAPGGQIEGKFSHKSAAKPSIPSAPVNVGKDNDPFILTADAKVA